MILHDTAGFSWPIRVLDPGGQQAMLQGLTNDISMTLDPETGLSVSGRNIEITISVMDLVVAGLEVPKNVPEREKKPWIVEFNDVLGRPHRLKVIETYPDASFATVRCKLGLFVGP